MKKIFSLLLATLLMGATLGGCGISAPSSDGAAPAGSIAPTPPSTGAGATSRADGEKLKIVATIFPYYDFSRAVAQDIAEITMLLKPGAEAHSFDPSPTDIITIENADVFIYTGGVDDAWAENLLASVDTSDITVLRMLDTVTLLEEETVEGMQAGDFFQLHEGHNHDEEGIAWDEHVWTTPKNAMLMMEVLSQTLQKKDPDNAPLYAQNAQQYIAELAELDADFSAIVASAKRRLMVFGDRFPFLYFAKEYDLSYRAAFPGCSTDTNPSAGTVAYLIDTVKENNLPYIFDIELSSGSIAKVIREETGAEILTMQSCQTLSSQNYEAGETYVSLMRQNADNLAKGLN